MRFVREGPAIPDDLLSARDQGRVVFFCGAGVSRARAGLPDFFGLAEKVISKLRVSQDSPARKLMREAQEIDKRIGISGVISADRVFGLLEREFLPRDIEAAVASALKPAPNCDRSAHQILFDLATTPDGIIRLVTTNFDRLFEGCKDELQLWQPPRLPDPTRPVEMNGIVYLHGKVTQEYDRAEGDGFVLSSSEFGRAYLSDGWATSFFRKIIEKYVVVFVGYTADDPPVQYLLEALYKSSERLQSAYAFQAGGLDDASARWRHKGVEAIAYDPADGHIALWHTLEAWARRAKDPNLWYSEVIELAKKGPVALAPHQRGQVAHIVSTNEGAKRFSEGTELPSAEWLCVFDPYRRYAKPGHIGTFQQRGSYVDPFDLYCLDSDSPPKKIAPDDHYAKREVPPSVWDAFALTRLDQSDLRGDNLPSLRGHWAENVPRLVPRLTQLGSWIAGVCNQPAAVWWASHQTSLHSDIRNQINWRLERAEIQSTSQIRQAWQFLFDSWKRSKVDDYGPLHELQVRIAKDGWDSNAIRRYVEIKRPYLDAGYNYCNGPKPPEKEASLTIDELIRREVKYPDLQDNVQIPDSYLATAIKLFRIDLELATAFEFEVGGHGLGNICPIVAEEDDAGSHHERTHGLCEHSTA